MRVAKAFNAALVICCTWTTVAVHAATGVGNGGDTLDLFLAATRESIVEIIARLNTGDGVASLCTCPTDTNSDRNCLALRGLNADQRSLCQQFITTTMTDMVRLNRPPTKVQLALNDEPLYIEGPGGPGDLKQVLARTKGPGAEIPIEFYAPGIRTLAPSQLLALLTHELGHKVRYKGDFLGDNLPYGAFSEPEGSRHLLDSVGAALATYAVQHGVIGRAFGIYDLFACSYSEKGPNFTFTAPETPGKATRQILAGRDQDAFETGVGLLPYDIQCLANSPDQKATFSFVVRAHEEDGCRTKGASGRRYTNAELWKFTGDTSAPPTLASAAPRLDGINPVCSGPVGLPIGLDYTEGNVQYHFQVRYLGSGAGWAE